MRYEREYEMSTKDDTLSITDAVITLAVPADIFTNEGNDTVSITNSTLNGAAGTSLFLGSGNDRLELSNSTMNVAMVTGEGNDYVSIQGDRKSVV